MKYMGQIVLGFIELYQTNDTIVPFKNFWQVLGKKIRKKMINQRYLVSMEIKKLGQQIVL